MSERRWVRVAAVDQIPLREGRAVRVADRDLALFNLGDRYLALDNRCPHEGGPLCDGIVTGRAVVCPLHGWKANLETGAIERPARGRGRCVETYPTEVVDGIVVVGVPGNRGRESFKEDTSGCLTISPEVSSLNDSRPLS